MRRLLVIALVIVLLPGSALAAGKAEKLAKRIVDAVESVNAWHAKKPGKRTEAALAAKLPESVPNAVALLVKVDDSQETRDALFAVGEACLDLDWIPGFEPVRERLAQLDPERAKKLGLALSRDRFLLRGTDGVEPELLERFATVFDGILDQYDETFGFAEWSKVPGKKLRVRVHLVDKITRPPHFAPQFRYHSEIDFPVVDPRAFTSPTSDGKFLFYGLCHELGHVIAMWGDGNTEEDHHAWAHYTGVVIVEALAEKKKAPKWLDGLRDARWRSLTKDREALEKKGVKPGRSNRDRVMVLLIALHDLVGPDALGAAINYVDEKDARMRINDVRYYTFQELRDGLVATLKSGKKRKAVKKLMD